jgi:hypothetical protein
MSAGPNGKPTINWVSVTAAGFRQSTKFKTVIFMKTFSSFAIYLASLAPVVALSLYISDTAAAQITRSFEDAIGVLDAISRALI